MRCFLLLIILAMYCTVSYANDAEEKAAVVDRVIKATNFGEFSGVSEVMFVRLLAKKFEEDPSAYLLSDRKDISDKFREQLKLVYQESFSIGELEQLEQFLRSETGKKFLSIMPTFNRISAQNEEKIFKMVLDAGRSSLEIEVDKNITKP
jgi:hypothetical protein